MGAPVRLLLPPPTGTGSSEWSRFAGRRNPRPARLDAWQGRNRSGALDAPAAATCRPRPAVPR